MDKINEFKSFIKTKPELISKVRNKEETWQSLYEVYDIYGSDSKAWDKYNDSTISSIATELKKIDPDSINKHLNTASKALDIISGLTAKDTSKIDKIVNNKVPIEHIFDD